VRPVAASSPHFNFIFQTENKLIKKDTVKISVIQSSNGPTGQIRSDQEWKGTFPAWVGFFKNFDMDFLVGVQNSIALHALYSNYKSFRGRQA
jgi:hypothetical protein